MKDKARYFISHHTNALYRLKEDTGAIHYLSTGKWCDSIFSTDDIAYGNKWTAISEDDAKLWMFERGY